MHGSTWWVRLNIFEKDYDREVDRLVNIGAVAGVATVILLVIGERSFDHSFKAYRRWQRQEKLSAGDLPWIFP